MNGNLVVLVEDDEDVRSSYSLILEPLGKLISFDSGSHFLTHLEKHPKMRPDLIVTDFSMPRMSGVQMVAAARLKGVNCPALLVSGHVDKETAIDAVNSSICTILEKPVSPDIFLGSARRLLEIRYLEKIRAEIVEGSGQLQELMVAFRDLCLNELELSGVQDAEVMVDANGKGGLSINEMLLSLENRLEELRQSEKSSQSRSQLHLVGAAGKAA